MKKLVQITAAFIFIISLCSCSTVVRNFELGGERTDIADVCIYNVDKSYDETNVYDLVGENEPIYVLTEEEKEEFLGKVESLTYSKEVIYFPIPMDGGVDLSGYIFCIRYEKGYDLLAIKGLLSFITNSNGEERYRYDYSNYSGETAWLDLFRDYIEVVIAETS